MIALHLADCIAVSLCSYMVSWQFRELFMANASFEPLHRCHFVYAVRVLISAIMIYVWLF